ncbi:MAG: class IV adenylate cyclase [Planctomycetota bacterium]|jgi:adenylate cyclase class 2
MCVEIEAKIKVDSLEQVEQKLVELGAEFVAEQLQKDSHLDDASATLISADCCLRLRRQVVGGSERHILTYKGAKERSALKRRREIEVEISDGDSMRKLLSALGYEEMLVVEKKRRLWRLGRCEIALDELPLLGSFVEIEGPDEKEIADVQQRLGLADVPHVAESYAHLIKEQIGRREA